MVSRRTVGESGTAPTADINAIDISAIDIDISPFGIGDDDVVDVRSTEPTIEMAAIPATTRRRRRPGRERPPIMPWRTWAHGLAELSLVGLVSTVLAWFALELWRLPFGLSQTYTGDELAGLAHIKGVDETGWWFTNPRLGAPFRLEHYDFPHGGETIQVFAVRMLGLFSDSPAAIMNAYFLLTYLLVAVVAYAVLRYLRFEPVLGAVIAVLYAFLPFHFWHHVGHIYRSGYFAAPLGALALLWLAGYDGGLVEPTGARLRHFKPRWGRLAMVLVAAVLIAGTDVVAAAFAPAIAGLLGVLAVLRQRAWRTMAVVTLFAVTVVGFVVALNVPTLIYRSQNGTNPETVQRQLAEQELYALKISRVILPSPGHRIDALADLGQKPRVSPITSEGGQALGFIGVIGLISGIVAALPLTSSIEGRPSMGASPRRRQLRQTAGLLMVLIIVTSVPSGLAYLGSVMGFEEIRTWNRIVVYLGFYALLCAGIGLEGIGRRFAFRGVPPAVIAVGFVIIGAFGFFDQTPGGRIPYEVRIEAWNRDAQFFDQLETSVQASAPAGPTINSDEVSSDEVSSDEVSSDEVSSDEVSSDEVSSDEVGAAGVDQGAAGVDPPMVFQLPVVDYPEPSSSSRLAYDHFRAYLHTDTVAWSHGAMRGRPEASWQRQLRSLPSAVILDGLAAIGFDGLYIDKWGYLDEGERLRSLIPDAVVLEDDRQFYYSLSTRADALTAEMTPADIDLLADELLYPVVPDYGIGFHPGSAASSGGVYGAEESVLGLAGSNGTARSITLGLLIYTAPGGGHEVRILDGNGTELAAGTSGTDDRTLELEVALDIPAEGLELHFVTDSPEYSAAGDPREIHMEVARLLTVGRAVGSRIALANEVGRIPFG